MDWDRDNPEPFGDQLSIYDELGDLPEPQAEEHSDPLEPHTHGVREVPLW